MTLNHSWVMSRVPGQRVTAFTEMRNVREEKVWRGKDMKSSLTMSMVSELCGAFPFLKYYIYFLKKINIFIVVCCCCCC